MSDAADFLSQHTDVPVIIDHAGSPYDQSSSGLLAWRQGLTQLAALDHVAIKLSGFGMFDNHRSVDSLRPMVEFILTTFGYERVMYGSNFPVDKLMGSFDAITNMVFDACDQLAESQRQAVFCDNAIKWYSPS